MMEKRKKESIHYLKTLLLIYTMICGNQVNIHIKKKKSNYIDSRYVVMNHVAKKCFHYKTSLQFFHNNIPHMTKSTKPYSHVTKGSIVSNHCFFMFVHLKKQMNIQSILTREV